MNAVLTYIGGRLGEHSTQVALAADAASLLSAVNGQITWSAFASVALGSLIAIVFPSK